MHESYTDVLDDFMTSVSAHGGLVHAVMSVRTLKVDGITSLVRNFLQLMGMDVSLKKSFGTENCLLLVTAR